ncbi:MAG: uridine diphosphate-N-acetylglucosamine-binding protein YvcK [Bacilli bacterium]|nr:uridine diphosphate-N-acetylglucosamine-binding protein YvcK [Bacilli bacterium]MDD3305349.1 uridine diphosphate-N-acetylglucosamine-binding protein YvcK [Bacilli bacterium]MDD4053250.1 uridine diphosphate-N-acetylglucosamine-binding protein YvcK [Bacilli bacterium]MDD4411226.1 uridine diphosphate-N-acetylglucosamine-binding protein YvcK [Bacilli bacterium]
MQRVVVLGGGHGLSVLLKGLKLFPVELTAVVAVSDDGSSTGKLRKEYNIPAVGDLRNVVISLSESEPLFEKLFQYRFKGSSDLAGHPVGNLLLAALTDINGSLTEAVASFSEILNLKGKVLPLTEDTVTLVAHTKQGEVLEGEEHIRKSGKEIERVEYKEKPNVLDEVITEIENADLIILGLGSLVTSIIPNLICPEVVQAIKKSQARVLYVCNAMTEHGETDNFTVSDHIKTLNKYLGEGVVNAVLANSKHIDVDIQERYKKLEHSEPVVVDDEEMEKLKTKLIKEDLIVIQDQMVRHDPMKTAFVIFSYLLRE